MRKLTAYPKLYRILRPLRVIPGVRQAFYEARSLIHFTQNAHLKRLYHRVKKAPILFEQALLKWEVKVPDFQSTEDFKSHLLSRGLRVHEGAHTLYLPPQEGLAQVLGEASTFYPEGAGFKILKNLGVPDQTRYILKDRVLEGLLTGTAYDVFKNASVLAALGLGPTVYDLAQLYSSNVVRACFVVEHIEGDWPSPDERQKFLDRVRTLMDEDVLDLVYPDGLRHRDFSVSKRENLKYDKNSKTTLCVDTQAFIVKDQKRLVHYVLHRGKEILEFGDTPVWRGKSYVYQSLPTIHTSAKRDTTLRWGVMMTMLEDAGYMLEGRMIMDVCCNSGAMLAMALTEGARWGIGWDLPEVIGQAKLLQKSIGFTRLDLNGANLHEHYDLAQDIPERLVSLLDEACVFFLAGVRHIGWPEVFAKIPWRILVYEGHEGDPMDETEEILKRKAKQWGAQLIDLREIRDGDCDVRPLALLLRT